MDMRRKRYGSEHLSEYARDVLRSMQPKALRREWCEPKAAACMYTWQIIINGRRGISTDRSLRTCMAYALLLQLILTTVYIHTTYRYHVRSVPYCGSSMCAHVLRNLIGLASLALGRGPTCALFLKREGNRHALFVYLFFCIPVC